MDSAETPKHAALEFFKDLALIFLPGLLSAPFLFILISTLAGMVGGLLVWAMPQLRSHISDWLLICSAMAVLVGVVAVQVTQWWQIRLDLSVTTNGVVVALLTLYVALAAASVRYALYSSDRNSLQWAQEIIDARRQDLERDVARQQNEMLSRNAVVSEMRKKLANCNQAVVATFGDHYKFARGQIADLMTVNKQAGCTVWLWHDSNITRLLPHPSLDRTGVVALQRGTISGPRVWFSSTVGLVPEDTPDFPVEANALLEQTYRQPRNADLGKLLAFQETHEVNRQRRLAAEMSAIQHKAEQPRFGYAQFALASLGQFVGAFGDMVKPVSVPAQIFDIVVGLLRTLFALVFFERLVNAGRK